PVGRVRRKKGNNEADKRKPGTLAKTNETTKPSLSASVNMLIITCVVAMARNTSKMQEEIMLIKEVKKETYFAVKKTMLHKPEVDSVHVVAGYPMRGVAPMHPPLPAWRAHWQLWIIWPATPFPEYDYV